MSVPIPQPNPNQTIAEMIAPMKCASGVPAILGATTSWKPKKPTPANRAEVAFTVGLCGGFFSFGLLIMFSTEKECGYFNFSEILKPIIFF